MKKQPYKNKLLKEDMGNKSNILIGEVYVSSIGYTPIFEEDPNKRISDVGAMIEVSTVIIDGKKTLDIKCIIPFSYDQQEMKESVAKWYHENQAAE